LTGAIVVAETGTGRLIYASRLLASWTPPRLFAALAEVGPACLLDSAQVHPRTGRYSILVSNPTAILSGKGQDLTWRYPHDGVERPVVGNPFRLLRDHLRRRRATAVPGLPPFQCGVVGLLGYELVRQLERLPATTVDDAGVPDLFLLSCDRCVVVDHLAGRVWAMARPAPLRQEAGGDGEARAWVAAVMERLAAGPRPTVERPFYITAPVTPHWNRTTYLTVVARVQRYIQAGDVFQVNLAQRFTAPVADGDDPWGLYLRLRAINPAPFAGFLRGDNFAVVSSSPERLVRVQGRVVESRPIAGTFRRPASAADLAATAAALRADPKERAEHLMLVDLIRNDLGRVCLYGTIAVDELLATEVYSHVVHLVSNVRGRLHPKQDVVDCLRACFPGGTITGVPKVRCMEILDELEPFYRGPYTGGLAYFSDTGAMDVNILIRSITVRAGRAFLHAGGGIVADSHPEREYHETLHKAAALVEALGEVSAATPGVVAVRNACHYD
jgi:anthranilate/para-aminobenzoate synthase component I